MNNESPQDYMTHLMARVIGQVVGVAALIACAYNGWWWPFGAVLFVALFLTAAGCARHES